MWRSTRNLVSALGATARARRRRGPGRPGWDFRAELVFTFLRRQWDEIQAWPVPRLRAEVESWPGPRDALRRVTRTPVDIGSTPAMWVAPRGDAHDAADHAGGHAPVILYFHGGSYLFGSLRTHGDVMARLALASGLRVLGIEYRLAPEHPYPAQLEDARAAYAWLLERGVAPARVALAGESAGGNLVAAALLDLRDTGAPLPACGVLMSPWLDLASAHPSMQRNAGWDYGTRDMLVRQARMFAGALAVEDPRISPLHAALAGLPPLLVQVGDAELLEDECRAFAERARDAGVDVSLDVLRDMPHAAQLLAAYVAEGQRAIERAAAFMRARVGHS